MIRAGATERLLSGGAAAQERVPDRGRPVRDVILFATPSAHS